VAEHFGVSVDYLLGRIDDPTPYRMPDPEKTPLDYRLAKYGVHLRIDQPLTDHDKQEILNYIEFKIEQQKRQSERSKGDSPQ
jgi:hypothetical protein